jgi:hypothetical protein
VVVVVEMKAILLLIPVLVLAPALVLAQTESEGSLAGFNAAQKALKKSHMGEDLTDEQVIALSNNPPKCPSSDTAFCKDFNLSWGMAIRNTGLDRGG